MSSNVIIALRQWLNPRKPKIKCQYCDRYVCERGMAQHVRDKHGVDI